MVIFRENTEDIYAGLEVEEGTPEAKKLIALLKENFGWDIREDSGVGIKPVSETGSKRLIRAAIELRGRARPQVGDARAQGQHPEVHRGRVPQLGLRARARRVLRRRRRLGRLRRQARRQGPREGQHRRHHVAAGAHPARRLRRDRDDEPQRRLPLRRARGAGRRHRHRAGRQHQLRHRPRRLRGDARHRAEVRGPGQGQPELGAAVGRDDVPAPRLDRSRRRHRARARGDDRRQDRHLRLRPSDGRRDRGEDLRVRGRRSSTASGSNDVPVTGARLRRACPPLCAPPPHAAGTDVRDRAAASGTRRLERARAARGDGDVHHRRRAARDTCRLRRRSVLALPAHVGLRA